MYSWRDCLITFVMFFFAQAMESSDFVLEAVSENEDLKRSIFEKLDKVNECLMQFCVFTCFPHLSQKLVVLTNWSSACRSQALRQLWLPIQAQYL